MDLPIQPIIDKWRATNPAHQQSRCTCAQGGSCASVESLARLVDVSHSTMHRRLRSQMIGVDEADRWSACLGLPVRAIWPDLDRDEWEPNVEVCG